MGAKVSWKESAVAKGTLGVVERQLEALPGIIAKQEKVVQQKLREARAQVQPAIQARYADEVLPLIMEALACLEDAQRKAANLYREAWHALEIRGHRDNMYAAVPEFPPRATVALNQLREVLGDVPLIEMNEG